MNDEQLLRVARRTVEIQAGDRVRIKSVKDIRATGVGLDYAPYYDHAMEQYSGQEFTVLTRANNIAMLHNTGWAWHTAWLERIERSERS